MRSYGLSVVNSLLTFYYGADPFLSYCMLPSFIYFSDDTRSSSQTGLFWYVVEALDVIFVIIVLEYLKIGIDYVRNYSCFI